MISLRTHGFGTRGSYTKPFFVLSLCCTLSLVRQILDPFIALCVNYRQFIFTETVQTLTCVKNARVCPTSTIKVTSFWKSDFPSHWSSFKDRSGSPLFYLLPKRCWLRAWKVTQEKSKPFIFHCLQIVSFWF